MITEASAKRFGELSNNEEFMAKMQQAQTMEEIHRCLNDNGVDVSLEDVKAAYEAGKEQYEGECSVEELDNVAGGNFFKDAAKLATNLVYGFCAVGFNMLTGGRYVKYIPKCRW